MLVGLWLEPVLGLLLGMLGLKLRCYRLVVSCCKLGLLSIRMRPGRLRLNQVRKQKGSPKLVASKP